MKRILDIAGATLASLLPSSNKLSIDSYGQSSSNMTPEEIQKTMQWLFFILGERGVHGQGSSDLGCWQPDLGQTRFDWSAERSASFPLPMRLTPFTTTRKVLLALDK